MASILTPSKPSLLEEPFVVGVAIDFGMTSSGVAFGDCRDTKTVLFSNQDLIGPQETSEKIPTTISYNIHGTVASWGFDRGNEQPRGRQEFKPLLDSGSENYMASSRFKNLGEVRDVVGDYIGLLFRSALQYITKDLTAKREVFVDLTITRPTTWNRLVVRSYVSIVREAFEKAAEQSTRGVYLNSCSHTTESLSAGYYVFNQPGKPKGKLGSIFYVLDIGGATTDPAFLRTVEDSEGSLMVESSGRASMPGLRNGCAAIDNGFYHFVIRELQSRWEEENASSDIKTPPDVLATMVTVANRLRFGRKWINYRNKYSKTSSLEDSEFEIPGAAVPSRPIIITKNVMEDIFQKELLTPILDLLQRRKSVLKSSMFTPDDVPPIEQIFLCGGGALIPRVQEFISDQVAEGVTVADTLMAPAIGALHLAASKADRLNKSIKVKTSKPGGKAHEMSIESTDLPPVYYKQWKWSIDPKVSALKIHVHIEFDEEMGFGRQPNGGLFKIRQEWIVRVLAEAFTPSTSQSVRYRIYLNLPSNTDVITAINFKTFQMHKNGTKTPVQCTAEKQLAT